MEDYTLEDVINALVQIPPKSRKRSLVDQRSYLIAVLAYKFFMSENQIARVSHYKRDRVHYNKKLALQFYNDRSYKENVYVQAVMFPFDLSEVETIRPHRSKRIELDIDSKFYRKLRAAGAILGHKDVRTTIKLFLEKSLKLWEE
jgi:hypothetical protein